MANYKKIVYSKTITEQNWNGNARFGNGLRKCQKKQVNLVTESSRAYEELELDSHPVDIHQSNE